MVMLIAGWAGVDCEWLGPGLMGIHSAKSLGSFLILGHGHVDLWVMKKNLCLLFLLKAMLKKLLFYF
jgi:hypothetical protein